MDDLSRHFSFFTFFFFLFIINRRANVELPTSPLPESTLITIHRCQVCNKEKQQQGNTTICLQCQDDEEIGRVMQNNTISVSQMSICDVIQ